MKKLGFHPFASIGKYWKEHHDSVVAFNVNFIATVLGIVLTFGTTMWYDHAQKTDAAEALVERCLKNMEERQSHIESLVEGYNRHNRLYAQLTRQPMDSISEELCYELIDTYTKPQYVITNHAYEKSFSQSVNSHEVLGEFAEVLGEGFEYLLYAEGHNDEINRLKKELLREQILDKNTYWDKWSMKRVVETALCDPNFAYFQNEFNAEQQHVRFMHDFLSFFIPAARRLWNGEMTYEDFRAQRIARWNNWHVNNQNDIFLLEK